jgi:hypothetical protein
LFSRHIEAFAHTLDGLRSFVDLVQPFLHRKSDRILKDRAVDLGPLLLAIMRSDPSVLAPTGISEALVRKMFDGDIEVEATKGGDRPSVSVKVSGPQSHAFQEAMYEYRRANETVDLLYQTSLVSLISAVDFFLSQSIHTYYRNTPGAISDTDKVFSLEDLRRFGTVEDARASLIEKKATDVMRGSIAGWVGFFKKQAALTMSYVDAHADKLVETLERRNLLVHNAGIVNSIYLSKVDAALRKGTKKGQRLQVTREYLDERIDFFERNSVLIVAELWKKLEPTDEARSRILSTVAYRHLQQSRWSIAEGLSYFMMMDKEMDEWSHLVGKLNYWQSMKRQGLWDKVKAEVESEDFSATGRRYQLGHLALREQKKEFFALVPVAIAGKEMTEAELREFPIFEDMRKDRRFAQYKAPARKKTAGKRGAGRTSQKKTSSAKKTTKKTSTSRR